jgi:hypothetical protein
MNPLALFQSPIFNPIRIPRHTPLLLDPPGRTLTINNPPVLRTEEDKHESLDPEGRIVPDIVNTFQFSDSVEITSDLNISSMLSAYYTALCRCMHIHFAIT